MDIKTIEREVIENMKTVFDPEIPVNIYDLGLIYEVKVTPKDEENHKVFILMTLTSPNCPVAESLPAEVRAAAARTKYVDEIEIELTFEPSWDKEMISEEAKLALGML